MKVRLQKVIAGAGVASRRKAEELILQGRVTVNGSVIRELGTRVDAARDHIKVDGHHLKSPEPHAYLMLNKPPGVVSSLSDPEGRPTIKDLLPGVRLRVFPVGRIDYDSEGLLLLTNHGELAQALLHPRYHVAKIYLTKVKGVLTDEEIRQLERGVQLDDGMTSPAMVHKVRKAMENSWLEITIHEGRKHQVKRMLEAVRHPVLKLKRVKFGPIVLGDLPAGRYRYLTDREANALRRLLSAPPAAEMKHPLPLAPPRPRRAETRRLPKVRAGRDRLSSITPARPRAGRDRLSSRGTRSFPGSSRRDRRRRAS